MKSRQSSAGDGHGIATVAWLAAFLATLSLVAVLAMARTAQALPLPLPAGPPAPHTAAAEDEEEAEAAEADEEETETCEEDEGPDEESEWEEAEEAEEETCEEDKARSNAQDGAEAPRECLLASAQPTVAASTRQDKIRLSVRYRTTSPVTVAVEYGLHGSKGSLFLGNDRKRLASRGTLRLTRQLTEAQMAKVVAAKSFTVRLHVSAAPGFCRAYFDHQLSVRRATPAGISWQQAK